MLTGLNHLTLAVNDLEKSFTFYTQTLGFTPHVKWKLGAYLSVGDLWLCLSLDKSKPSQDYSHIAFNISQEYFVNFLSKIIDLNIPQWKENRSEGNSVYFLDPDGHKLEVHVGDLKSRLESLKHKPYEDMIFLS